MSKFKGTPGPWSVPHFADRNIQCDCKWIFSDDSSGCLVVATINVAKTDDDYEHPQLPQAKANALLISKAPEMLAMLEKIVSELHGMGYVDINTLEKAEDLIKEATGL